MSPAKTSRSSTLKKKLRAPWPKLPWRKLRTRNSNFPTIVAPVSGRIAEKTVQTGNRVSVGQALMAVVEDNVWILANLKETQLERVRVGQPVEIKIDALPHYRFSGRVDSLQPGTGSNFALLSPDNATGNFIKIVQ